jgi:hypothetical protein
MTATTSRRGLKEDATVSYPIAKARGLHLRSITLTPSGALLAVHPYPVRIGWPADNQSGAVRPVYVQATPTISPALRPMPLDVTILSTLLAVTPRDSSIVPQKGDGASSPCLQAGVSAPDI